MLLRLRCRCMKRNKWRSRFKRKGLGLRKDKYLIVHAFGVEREEVMCCLGAIGSRKNGGKTYAEKAVRKNLLLSKSLGLKGSMLFCFYSLLTDKRSV